MGTAAATWVELEGTVNTRDLGGLPAANGRTVRPGVLFRSDAPFALTTEDVSRLRAAGLRHVLDLRSDAERNEQGRGRLGDVGIAFSEFDVLAGGSATRSIGDGRAELSGDELEVFMSDSYLDFLERGADRFVRALERLTAGPGVPALVHCSAGKDRTGVMVALLLGAAGVTRAAIVDDYAATDERVELILERLACQPAFAELVRTAPAMSFGARHGTMERFLDHLEAVGGARHWLLRAGAHPVTLDAWERLLLA